VNVLLPGKFKLFLEVVDGDGVIADEPIAVAELCVGGHFLREQVLFLAKVFLK
jgi:hypothetical protein